jgi:glutamate formiminotransferase/formiminotetrahydrofolate cyclodeaminase
MQLSFDSLTIIKQMAEVGNPNSVSDAGVGALCARSAVVGAFMNVRINASAYNDKKFVEDIISKGREVEQNTIKLEAEILRIVNEKIGV